jgi:hypothetical protein
LSVGYRPEFHVIRMQTIGAGLAGKQTMFTLVPVCRTSGYLAGNAFS